MHAMLCHAKPSHVKPTVWKITFSFHFFLAMHHYRVGLNRRERGSVLGVTNSGI